MRLYQIIALFGAFLAAGFIFYISSLSFPPSPAGFDLSAIYHFGIFFWFTLFLLIASKFNKKLILLVLVISLFYAGIDELHQYFVPNRVADWFDFGTDFAGSLVSLGLISIIKKYAPTIS